MSIVESFGPTAVTMGGAFFVDILIGYALKKVIKIAAVIVGLFLAGLFLAGLFLAGLFLAGLAYLQYHQIANIKLE